mmetsp:Transcript_3225/g.10919  ORF Transcript_3225/g.10919 Transcript_3225/m.10919 type:complete len:230 (+) Transcript_3225:2206-2895(+)
MLAPHFCRSMKAFPSSVSFPSISSFFSFSSSFASNFSGLSLYFLFLFFPPPTISSPPIFILPKVKSSVFCSVSFLCLFSLGIGEGIGTKLLDFLSFSCCFFFFSLASSRFRFLLSARSLLPSFLLGCSALIFFSSSSFSSAGVLARTPGTTAFLGCSLDMSTSESSSDSSPSSLSDPSFAPASPPVLSTANLAFFLALFSALRTFSLTVSFTFFWYLRGFDRSATSGTL